MGLFGVGLLELSISAQGYEEVGVGLREEK